MTPPTTAIGIDFGGTSIKSAVVRDGLIVQRGDIIDTLKHDGRSLFDALYAVVDALRAAHADAAGVGANHGILSLHSKILHRCDTQKQLRSGNQQRVLRQVF